MHRPDHKTRALALLALGLFVFIVLRGRAESTVGASPEPATALRGSVSAPESRGSSTGSVSARVEVGGSGAPSEGALALPSSLRGTDVDGVFDTDATGRFRPTPRALRVFDYFLSAVGEVSMDRLRELVRAHALTSLPAEEVEEVMGLFDLYLAYQERSESLGPVEEDGLEDHFERVKELQSEVFGSEDAESIFGRQNALSDVTLARRELLLDESLDEAARGEALLALEMELPEDIRAVREAMAAPALARAEVDALRRAGASDAEVFALRESHFGPEAAGRLAALDSARATWEARVASYRVARDLVLQRESDDALEHELDLLRAARFDPTESLRVAALDRIELGI